MMRLLSLALLCAGTVLDSATAAAEASAPRTVLFAKSSECGDLLAQAHRKPPQLTYLGCRFAAERQAKPLVARYRVSGAHAAAVEAYLIRKAGLPRLKRSCCQWDSAHGRFTDPRGQDYSIYMVSDENSVSSRRDWRKIRRFEVVVETLTEEV